MRFLSFRMFFNQDRSWTRASRLWAGIDDVISETTKSFFGYKFVICEWNWMRFSLILREEKAAIFDVLKLRVRVCGRARDEKNVF